jgi:hypothetical protein
VPIKRILGWAAVITVACYVFTKPAGSAAAMHGVVHALSSAGTNLAKFLSTL